MTTCLVIVFCNLGVTQGENVSPFLFSMYLNDIKEYFMIKGDFTIELKIN